MQIMTECEKTIMFKVTWRDVYGEMQTDFVVMNNSESRLTEEDWEKAAEEIIKTTNGENSVRIIVTAQVKHNNIYIAIV